MKLDIARDKSGDSGTFSIGTLEGGQSWQFIELPWRGNQARISCVPAGTYRATLADSQHFGRKVYFLYDVPNRYGIEMHPANWAGDVNKGLHSDLKGCCAPGIGRGQLIPPDTGVPQDCVTQSGQALKQLIAATGGDNLEITFRWTMDNPEGEDNDR